MEKTTQDILRGIPPYEGEEDYVFISYCHRDMADVLPVFQRLRGAGIRFWYDEGIDPGTEWPESIARHLLDCKVCMALITPEAIASKNCQREIHFALSKDKGFLSVILQPTTLTAGLELQISAYQSLSKYKYGDEEAFYERLLSLELLASCRREQPNAEEPARREEQLGMIRDLRAAGDKARKQRDLDGALEHYRKWEELEQQLAEQRGGPSESQCQCWERIGYVLGRRDPRAAAEYYEKSIAGREALLREKRTPEGVQQLGKDHYELSLMLYNKGEKEQLLVHRRACYSLLSELYGKWPGFDACEMLAHSALDQFGAELKNKQYRQALAIAEKGLACAKRLPGLESSEWYQMLVVNLMMAQVYAYNGLRNKSKVIELCMEGIKYIDNAPKEKEAETFRRFHDQFAWFLKRACTGQ